MKKICEEHDVLFVADEVITGFGRASERFGIEHYDIEPDPMTTAKAFGGNFPIGATIASPEVADAFDSVDYFSTFSGNPVVTAAAKASVDVIREQNLVEAAREKLLADLATVDDVRGEGLMFGVNLVDPKMGELLPAEYSLQLKCEALDRNVVLPAGQGVGRKHNPPQSATRDRRRTDPDGHRGYGRLSDGTRRLRPSALVRRR